MKKATLVVLLCSPLIIGLVLILSGTSLDPGQRAIEEWEAELPTSPTPTVVPLPLDFGCKIQGDLERFRPGDQVKANRGIWLIENPVPDHPLVTGILVKGDILIVHENDLGVFCADVDGDIYYYVHLISEGETMRGFARPEGLEKVNED